MQTNRLITFVLFFCLSIPFIAEAQPFVRFTPRWYRKPPQEQGRVFGVGEGSSSNQDVARRKAVLNANVQIAEQVETVLRTVTVKVDSIIKDDKVLIERVTNVRTSVKAELKGTSIEQIAYKKNRNGYTAYVLVAMDKESVRRTYVDALRSDAMLRDALGGEDD